MPETAATPSPEALDNRFRGMVDILYLSNVVVLYIFSIIYPFFGLVMGLVLMLGSLSAQGKKVGRICLILGIINIALVIIGLVLVFLVAGGLTGVLGD